jgi:coenzyme F420-0:L-glutamate ligase
MNSVRLYAVKTRLVKTGDNLVEVVLEALKEQKLTLEDNDVLVLTSKIVAHVEARLVNLNEVKPSEKAKELAKKFSLQQEVAELILREADKVYGGVEKAVLTLKNGVLTANAGIDKKNVPEGYVALWPKKARETAKKIREEIKRKTGKTIAVLIVDSGLAPLRKGTVGVALAVAGFKPIEDYRGREDLYGKKLTITQHAVADNLASAAHLLMDEAAEKTPIVLVKDAPLSFDEKAYGTEDMAISHDECIFMKALSTGTSS